jgi:hypothetical protein
MVTKAEIHWNATDRASEALVDAMIADVGIDDERAKKASRIYALSLLEDDSLDIDMGELEHITGCFAEGYEQALKDMGSH